MKAGKNPAATETPVKVEEETVVTIDGLLEEFLARKIRKEHRRPEYAEELLRKNILPALGNRNICEVTTREIVRTLEAIADRGAAVLANRTASLTKQMFSFAVQRGLRIDNPCSVLTKTTIGGRESPRSRYLKYQEIWQLWKYLDEAPVPRSMSIATKLLLVTGQRRGELMLGEWSHFDFDNRIWRIPKELSKNGAPHDVPLNSLAMQLLQELKGLAYQSQFLFPSPQIGPNKPSDIRGLNVFMRKVTKKLKIENCSPHVLRHTFSTLVGGLGAPLHVIEKILNHSLGGMLAVYNHHDFMNERCQVLETWGRRLDMLIQAASLEEVKAWEAQWRSTVQYPSILEPMRNNENQVRSPPQAVEYVYF